jgi:hypothetical protein
MSPDEANVFLADCTLPFKLTVLGVSVTDVLCLALPPRAS